MEQPYGAAVFNSGEERAVEPFDDLLEPTFDHDCLTCPACAAAAPTIEHDRRPPVNGYLADRTEGWRECKLARLRREQT